MKPLEVVQLVREFEILKVCSHSNIIRILEFYVNSIYFHIVLEHMQGQDLFYYVKDRDFSIDEGRTKNLVLQIAITLEYL